jgi:cysteinyl-tRNA synthetase
VNINHEKMSKSLGNFLMIKDIVKMYHPEAVRLFLLSHHYRSPVDFTDLAIKNVAAGLDKIYAMLERAEKFLGSLPDRSSEYHEEVLPEKNFWELFCNAMNDDFNTAQGVGYIYDAVRTINRLLDDADQAAELKQADDMKHRQTIHNECVNIMKMADILGLIAESPGTYFQQKKEKVIVKASIDADMIEALIQDRKDARKAKDFRKADEIRDQLKEMNIEIEDRPEGTIWKVLS